MKLIGKMAGDSFIAEIGVEELANFAGYSSKYNDKCPRFEVGQIIQLSAVYRKIYRIAECERDLKRAADTLRLIAESLTLIEPIISEANKEE